MENDRDIYDGDNCITLSDVREKENIKRCKLGLNFINSLKPVKYTWKDGKRPHYGFISQDVKKVMDKYGIDFGGYVRKPKYSKINGEDVYVGNIKGLRYYEFVSPIVASIQEMTTITNNLKTGLKSLYENTEKHNKILIKYIQHNEEKFKLLAVDIDIIKKEIRDLSYNFDEVKNRVNFLKKQIGDDAINEKNTKESKEEEGEKNTKDYEEEEGEKNAKDYKEEEEEEGEKNAKDSKEEEEYICIRRNPCNIFRYIVGSIFKTLP